MPGDADATRKRLLEAGANEFAAYGIAGARVDRIADAARSNKAQIYHYFGSKDALFDAVVHEFVVDFVRRTPIDVDDLPGYAARLHDRYLADDRLPRIAAWLRLERGGAAAPLSVIVESNRAKAAAVEQAQRAGRLTTRWPAAELIALVQTVAGLWSTMSPEHAVLFAGRTPEQRRAVIVDAVATLIAPAAQADSAVG